MKLLVVLVLALFLVATALAQEETKTKYILTIHSNGETSAIIEIAGQSIVLPLPQDVLTPYIKNGSYESIDTGIKVTGDKAVIEFTSSYYTRKEEGVWYFNAPLASGSGVKVILPKEVKVVQATPKPIVSKTTELTLTWLVADEISFSYVFLDDGYRPTEKKSNSWSLFWLVVLGILGALLIVTGAAFFLKKKRQNEVLVEKNESLSNTAEEASKNVTEAQMNILRAANHNEAVVLRTMLKHNGQIKRNMLEKETGLSKSSLASSLHNLEKKNIIEIDRSFHVHYITLSAWFKELKS